MLRVVNMVGIVIIGALGMLGNSDYKAFLDLLR